MPTLFGERPVGPGDLGDLGGNGQAVKGSGMPPLVVDTKGGLPLTSDRWVGGDLGDRAAALGDMGKTLEVAAAALGDRECAFATGCWVWEDLGDRAAVLGDRKDTFAVEQWVPEGFRERAAALGDRWDALGDAAAAGLEGAATGAGIACAGSNPADGGTAVPCLTASLGDKAAATDTCTAADGTRAIGAPKGTTSLAKRPDLFALAERFPLGRQSCEALPWCSLLAVWAVLIAPEALPP